MCIYSRFGRPQPVRQRVAGESRAVVNAHSRARRGDQAALPILISDAFRRIDTDRRRRGDEDIRLRFAWMTCRSTAGITSGIHTHAGCWRGDPYMFFTCGLPRPLGRSAATMMRSCPPNSSSSPACPMCSATCSRSPEVAHAIGMPFAKKPLASATTHSIGSGWNAPPGPSASASFWP